MGPPKKNQPFFLVRTRVSEPWSVMSPLTSYGFVVRKDIHHSGCALTVTSNMALFNSLAAKLFSAVFMRISFCTYNNRNSSHTHAYYISIYSAAISEYYSSKINVIIHIIINTVDLEATHFATVSTKFNKIHNDSKEHMNTEN